MNEKINNIKKILSQYTNHKYVSIKNNNSINNIYELFVNDVMFESNDTTEYIYLIFYHKLVTYNYDLMKMYCLKAIEYSSGIAMNILAGHYHITEINHDLAKKYYLMAIDHDNYEAMNNLAQYYHITEINYVLMKKYYLMAIMHDVEESMIQLGNYYLRIKKNYVKMKKYYMMAIDRDNIIAMNNLSYYYISRQNDKAMLIYMLKSINVFTNYKSTSMQSLIQYYKNNDSYANILELLLNYFSITHRTKIIHKFNKYATYELLPKQKTKFMQLVNEFEFNNEDELCDELKLLIK